MESLINIGIILTYLMVGFAALTAIGFGIKKSKGQLIIVMDTDFTHNPNLISKLIYYCKKHDFSE